MNKKILDILIKRLEEDINKYYGDWGTLEHGVEDTFNQILEILKVMNGEISFEFCNLEELETKEVEE